MNAIIFILLVAANLFQFLIVPVLSPAWALTLIPLAFTSNTLWAMIHEGIHGHTPRWQGRILACVFGSSFTFLASAHLTHHALNRTKAERLEIVPPGEPMWKARLRYYFFLAGGLYLSELFVPLAFVLPFMSLMRIAARSDKFTESLIYRACVKSHQIFLESLCALTLLGVSAYLYGERWSLLVGIIFARAFFISWLDYIYHYGSALDRDEGVFNLWLPAPLRVLLLNFNMHRSHHHSTSTDWRDLPTSRLLTNATFFQAALRVWRGPVRQPSHD
jgi:fatty acid desaturase